VEEEASEGTVGGIVVFAETYDEEGCVDEEGMVRGDEGRLEGEVEGEG